MDFESCVSQLVQHFSPCVERLLQLAQVTLAAVQAWKKLDDDTKASFDATAEGASWTQNLTAENMHLANSTHVHRPPGTAGTRLAAMHSRDGATVACTYRCSCVSQCPRMSIPDGDGLLQRRQGSTRTSCRRTRRSTRATGTGWRRLRRPRQPPRRLRARASAGERRLRCSMLGRCVLWNEAVCMFRD